MKLIAFALYVATLTGPAIAQGCGTVKHVHHVSYDDDKKIVRFPVFRYEANGTHAVIIKQHARVNADGAIRSYALDGHGFSYLCDGLTWKSSQGYTFRGECPKNAAEAIRRARRNDSGVLHFSKEGPTLCVFGFHVSDGLSGQKGCNNLVVGGGVGGSAPVVEVKTSGGTHPHFVSTTSVKNIGGHAGTPEREIDAAAIPFIVRPGEWSDSFPQAAFELRDYAYVYSPGPVGVKRESLTGPRGVFALVADSGPKKKFGEASIALHQLLAFGELKPAPAYMPTPKGKPHPRAQDIFHPFLDTGDGDVRAKANIYREVWYVMFPQSSQQPRPSRYTYERHGSEISGNIQETASKAADALGGTDAIIGCLAKDAEFNKYRRVEVQKPKFGKP
jgi:hypothetical protein